MPLLRRNPDLRAHAIMAEADIPACAAWIESDAVLQLLADILANPFDDHGAGVRAIIINLSSEQAAALFLLANKLGDPKKRGSRWVALTCGWWRAGRAGAPSRRTRRRPQ